jgi:Helix-turn-helix of DDE superfamily endonuclease
MGLQIRDERHLKAFTGLSHAEFDHLLPVFSEVYTAQQHQRYTAGIVSGTRSRQPGGGAKGKLPTLEEKLLFVLYYYKTYPTFDVLGTQFALGRSKAHENLYKLSPILHKTLVRLEMMPHRAFTTLDEFKAALQDIDRVIIDATERAYRRSQDDATQREYYSGKKKSIL